MAWLNCGSFVAQIVRPLFGKRTSASQPSSARSAMRSSGVRPDSLRSFSWPWRGSTQLSFAWRKPSVFWWSSPLSPTTMLGSRSWRCSGIRSRRNPRGSCTWPSADTMKNLSSASGRADRTQPALPGVAVRQALLTSGSGITVTAIVLSCSITSV